MVRNMLTLKEGKVSVRPPHALCARARPRACSKVAAYARTSLKDCTETPVVYLHTY